MIKFEWDTKKSITNIQKHGISFQEATTVFYDNEALLIEDIVHSDVEERFILLGLSDAGNLLVVCHCYREQEEIIRIISTRKATKKEIEKYKEKK